MRMFYSHPRPSPPAETGRHAAGRQDCPTSPSVARVKGCPTGRISPLAWQSEGHARKQGLPGPPRAGSAGTQGHARGSAALVPGLRTALGLQLGQVPRDSWLHNDSMSLTPSSTAPATSLRYSNER